MGIKHLRISPQLNDIVIQKSDKGYYVVVVNHDDYIKQMQSLISDPAKFQKLLVL